MSSNARRGGPRQRRDLAKSPEFRRFSATGLEVRSAADSSSGMVEVNGEVIVYGVPYTVNDGWGGFTETIHFGACADLLQRADLDVRFLFNHGDMPYARTGSPTCPLTLTEATSGLQTLSTVDTRMTGAADLVYAMENKLITQMSVGMEVDPEGDIWSGSDDYGMPNVRDIVRLANVFDVSAVTFPASPTTSIELAARAWDRVPEESRERTRKLWAIARDVRTGTATKAEADTVMHVLERMHQVDDETRNEPTAADAGIAVAINAAKKSVADAIAAQTADPDNNSDPVDKKILAALQAAEASLAEAMAGQAKDGTPDKAAEPAETKSVDDGEPEGDPDGTDAGGAATAPTAADGTGSRSLKAELDLLRFRRK